MTSLKSSKTMRFPDASGAYVYGYSLTNSEEPIPAAGKWVGVLSRPGDDAHVIPGRPFRGLRRGETGCLFFKEAGETDSPGTPADVQLYRPETSIDPEPLNGIICRDEVPHPHGAPEWRTAADKCRRAAIRLSLVGDSGQRYTTTLAPDTATPVDSRLKTALGAILSQPGAAQYGAQFAAYVEALSTAGPWFPCELNGCCRAF
ncbi:MAG: hypothetical protein SF070_11405 [Gemmatimonadota bacterium]|nr:hypothetical protein [Gemmatimonadota bacterium]